MNQVVLGIIRRDGKFLVGKVKKESLEEFGGIPYIFPGGNVKPKESPEDAVRRKIIEETGMQAESYKLIAKRIHPVTSYEIFYFYCEVKASAVPDKSKLDDSGSDIDSFEWVLPEELKEYMPTLNPEVAEYFSL